MLGPTRREIGGLDCPKIHEGSFGLRNYLLSYNQDHVLVNGMPFPGYRLADQRAQCVARVNLGQSLQTRDPEVHRLTYLSSARTTVRARAFLSAAPVMIVLVTTLCIPSSWIDGAKWPSIVSKTKMSTSP